MPRHLLPLVYTLAGTLVIAAGVLWWINPPNPLPTVLLTIAFAAAAWCVLGGYRDH